MAGKPFACFINDFEEMPMRPDSDFFHGIDVTPWVNNINRKFVVGDKVLGHFFKKSVFSVRLNECLVVLKQLWQKAISQFDNFHKDTFPPFIEEYLLKLIKIQ